MVFQSQLGNSGNIGDFMHRTSGDNNVAGMFTDGPPGTTIEERWLNSVQEEIAAVIESAGLQLKNPEDDTNDQLLLAIPIIAARSLITITITSSYTITDVDGVDTIECNPTSRAFTVTLPTQADNKGRTIIIKVTHKGGNVTVTGEGAETIDGQADFFLNRQYDFIEVYCGSTKWIVKHCFCSYSTGWINTADWTLRLLGSMQITYNAGAGSFIVGELITESVGGNTWIITSDTGAVLTCKEATGTGFATNTRTITGSTSGCARTVNGTTKNVDTYISHDLVKSIGDGLKHYLVLSTDATDNNSFITYVDRDAGGNVKYNYTLNQISTSQLHIYAAENGFVYYDKTGSAVNVDSEDWYYKIIIVFNR